MRESIAALSELKHHIERIRTKIGTGEEQAGKGFFKLIELHIETTGGIINQGRNQLKQAEICISHVKSFELKYLKLLSAIEALQKSYDDRIKLLEDRIKVFEDLKEDEAAVKNWFSGKSKLIITIASVIAAGGVIMASYHGLIGVGGG